MRWVCGAFTVAIIFLIPALGDQLEEPGPCLYDRTRECYETYYRKLAAKDALRALADIRERYGANPFISIRCHTFMHVIGNEVARTLPLHEALRIGTAFCRAGYYHGIMEILVAEQDPEKLVASCALDGPAHRRQLCAHGIGHGFHALESGDWQTAIERCSLFSDDMYRRGCYGGVFMANSFLAGNAASHDLRAADPHYPCNTLTPDLSHICYRYHILSIEDNLFTDASSLYAFCRDAPLDGRSSCFESIGALWTVRNAHRTGDGPAWCAGEASENERAACERGLLKGLQRLGDTDAPAREFCAGLGVPARTTCFDDLASFADLE